MSRLGVSGLGQPARYGLILPSKPSTTTTSKPTAPIKKAPLKNVFGVPDDDEDEDEDDTNTKKRVVAPIQQMVEHRQKKLERLQKEALAVDSTVFDYDTVQPSFAAARADQQQQQAEKQVERKSQYIATLLKKAEFRTKEQELILEKKRVKDRQQEDHLYAGKEKFVTAAYKKKLMEEQRWLEEQKAKDALDAANDVTKKSSGNAMLSFYSNVLNAGTGTRSHIIEEQIKSETVASSSSPSSSSCASHDDRRKRSSRSRSPERDPKRVKTDNKPTPTSTSTSTASSIETSTSTSTSVKAEPSPTPTPAPAPSTSETPTDTSTASATAPTPTPVPAAARDPAAEAEARRAKAEEAKRKYLERKKATQSSS